jgi:hypothetical protein
MKPQSKRHAALRDAITEEVRHLLNAHIDTAEKRAAEADTAGDKPVMAKIRLSVEWPAGAQSPEVTTKIAYGLPTKGESKTTVDPDQQKLDLPDAET